MSSRCFHNMVNFGPLAAEIGPVVFIPSHSHHHIPIPIPVKLE